MQTGYHQCPRQRDPYAEIDRLLAISMLSKRLAQKLAMQMKQQNDMTKGEKADEPHERTGRRYYRIA